MATNFAKGLAVGLIVGLGAGFVIGHSTASGGSSGGSSVGGGGAPPQTVCPLHAPIRPGTEIILRCRTAACRASIDSVPGHPIHPNYIIYFKIPIEIKDPNTEIIFAEKGDPSYIDEDSTAINRSGAQSH
jgi:hypothetical protein